MEKYILIKKENNYFIIDIKDYLIIDSKDYNKILNSEIIMSSNNILDLIQEDDLIEVTKPDFDNGNKDIVVNYIPVISKDLLNYWLKSGLNVITIYKKDKDKNFIRIAEKINKEWRLK